MDTEIILKVNKFMAIIYYFVSSQIYLSEFILLSLSNDNLIFCYHR